MSAAIAAETSASSTMSIIVLDCIVNWVLSVLELELIAASRACLASSKARVLAAISEFDIEQLSGLASGLALIVIGRIMHQHAIHQKEMHIDLYNIILFSGGILVALSHKINSLLCNTCTKCNIK